MIINQITRMVVVASGILGGACALSLAASVSASAGDNPTVSNVIPPAVSVTMHARIDAIDRDTREIRLTGRSGMPITVVAGPGIRLDMLKVGDTVNATFYRSVAFIISQPGITVPEDQMNVALARPATAPGGVAVKVTRVSGLVVGIDLAAHSVDLVPPGGGGVYTFEVTDPARQASLPALKVGDTITAAVSQTLAVSVEPAPRSWF